ncbi:MAG: restriction endonuclease subunit R, partial [Spirochaetes bacterium]|nr:restriction endonuclease subunit R [Spirochaetota bacterium]
NENVVSEYLYEQSVADGVNVPYDVYTIETEITKNGAEIKAKEYVDKREKLSRKKRWQQLDEDYQYASNQLDKDVVNISQIRNIIKAFKQALHTAIFPKRIDENGEYEVPKTLVFAKTDSHADDIIAMIREEFNEGNDFCKKITCKVSKDIKDENGNVIQKGEKPKDILTRFRNSYYPRIAVTVDMIATGTDVKPLEVLLFMRDVKSVNYYEQMKGRGTRTINKDDLQLVTKTAEAKTHFVIVDAVGATKSKKTDSRPLERKPSIPLKDLLGAITVGVTDEDLFLSLANRLIRLDKQLTEKEKVKLLDYSGGKDLKKITKELISAYDPDSIEQLAIDVENKENIPNPDEAVKIVQQKLIETAASTFNGELNEYIENVRKIHEQIIDHINIDTVTKSEWDTTSIDKAEEIIKDFETYLETHKDEIQALSIFYNQPYNRRDITFKMIKDVMERLKLDKPSLAPDLVWQAYSALEEVKTPCPKNELTALVSLIRKVCGIDKNLTAYDKTIDKNFQTWVFQKQAGKLKFTEEQMNWLRMLKEHVTSSFHIEMEDLDYTPFDSKGGRGKMYQLFGDQMNEIIDELNEALVA